jgi:hypothetical protein
MPSFRRRCGAANRFEPAEIFFHRAKTSQISFEDGVGLHTVLKAAQAGLEFLRALAWKRIDHPVLMALGIHQSLLSHVGEVLGNLHLWLVQKFLEVAHAQWTNEERIEDAQSGLIAKALKDLD